MSKNTYRLTIHVDIEADSETDAKIRFFNDEGQSPHIVFVEKLNKTLTADSKST